MNSIISYVLLDLELLELDELGSTALQLESSTSLVDAAFFTRAVVQWSEAQCVDLKHKNATKITMRNSS